MIRNQNFKRYIEAELEKLNAALPRRTRIFIAGGAAMAFYGLKEATKDIDVATAALRSSFRNTAYMRNKGFEMSLSSAS